jgi:CheY-like chemotaxis protein
MKILIADDEEVVRSTLEGILQKSGHETESAFDGEEAVKKALAAPFDLVLLDLAMPKLDGYEVLKQLRAVKPKLPVIFITATGEAKKVAQSIAQHGLNGFIEKPFTPEKVLEIVTQALTRK